MEANDWITLSAVTVAVIATVPAYLSLRITRAAADAAIAQTNLQREIAHDARMPMLWADLRPHPEHRSMMYLFVGNSGPTTAHDVKVIIEPRVLPGSIASKCDAGQDAAASGIAALPPGRSLEWSMGVAGELLKVPGQPNEFTITVTGTASDGSALVDSFRSRFSDIRFTSAANGSAEDLAQQSKHLLTEFRALNKSVQRIAGDDE